jgi:hypothetical protein
VKFEEDAANKRRKVLGEDHPDTIRSVEHLAEIHRKLNKGTMVGDEIGGAVHCLELVAHKTAQTNGIPEVQHDTITEE